MTKYAIALALLLPMTAFAQQSDGVTSEDAGPETVGSMSGTLNGQQVSYTIHDGEGVETGFEEIENGLAVTLDAYPADTPVDDSNLLRLRFTALTGAREPELTEAEVTMTYMGTTYVSPPEATGVSLDSLEVSDESLLILGNVRATVSESGEVTSVVADEGMTLSLDLQANLFAAEAGEGS